MAAESHSHPHPLRHSASRPDFGHTTEAEEQMAAIESQLSTVVGLQRADHAMLTALNEAVGTSPDAATGAEGRGMRKQLADVANGVKSLERDTAELKKDMATLQKSVAELTSGRGDGKEGLRVTHPTNSTPGVVGSIVAGMMATIFTVIEVLKIFGVLK